MPVRVMQCTSATKHPNADSLNVYQFSDLNNLYKIVANQQIIYNIGDKAIIALHGSNLKDGGPISISKLRGVKSCGMAIGKTEEPVGTDLTEEYSIEDGFVKWPSIQNLYNIVNNEGLPDSVTYKYKIKLHGTNSGVQIRSNGDIIPQSHDRIISVENDNQGFAAWVAENLDYFKSLVQPINFTICGEWVGSKLSKGTSLANIEERAFFIFGIQFDSRIIEPYPETIQTYLKYHNRIHVIPWEGWFILNFANKEELDKSVNQLNKVVKEIEECDPYIKRLFNIEGAGEGLVAYPILDRLDYYDMNEIAFKAKAKAHRVVKNKNAVQIAPEVANSINEFVDLMVTEQRLEQISQNIERGMKNTGAFVQALLGDVKKESVEELKASNLEWKQVSSAVGMKASQWWRFGSKKE